MLSGGNSVYGKIAGVPVFCLFGTRYYNDGATSAEITFGVRVSLENSEKILEFLTKK